MTESKKVIEVSSINQAVSLLHLVPDNTIIRIIGTTTEETDMFDNDQISSFFGWHNAKDMVLLSGVSLDFFDDIKELIKADRERRSIK